MIFAIPFVTSVAATAALDAALTGLVAGGTKAFYDKTR